MKTGPRLLSVALVAGLVAASGLSAPARADDTEVFFYQPPSDNKDRPNVLFILDTGNTMGQDVTAAEPYAPGTSYKEKLTDDQLKALGNCDDNRLYFGFMAGGGKYPATCNGLKSVKREQFVCDNTLSTGAFESQGWAQTSAIVFGVSGQNRWSNLDPAIDQVILDKGTSWVECRLDEGLHSTVTCPGPKAKSACWPIDNHKDGAPWGTVPTKKELPATVTAAAGLPTEFYTANFIAYNAYVAGLGPDVASTRIEQVKTALLNVLGSISGVNVALMRMSMLAGSANGGMVLHHFMPVEDAVKSKSFETTLNGESCNSKGECLPTMYPYGRRPLGETLYEAYRYYAGLTVDFGVNSNITYEDPLDPNNKVVVPKPSVWQSWSDVDVDPGVGPERKDTYNSPITDQVCASDNYIVLLTDGFTEQDRNSDGGKIGAAADFPSWDAMIRADAPSLQANGTCEQTTYTWKVDPEDPANLIPDYTQETFNIKGGPGEDVTVPKGIPGSPEGAASGSYCLDDLADYMYSVGIGAAAVPIDERTKVKTFTVGFDLNRLGVVGDAARSILVETAHRGGGKYYDAKDAETLETQVTDIVRQILIENSSFTSPSVAVNSFNRTQNLNDLYFSVFKPGWTYRWLGNVKRYRLVPTAGPVCDANAVCDPNDIWDAKNQDAVEIVQSGKDKGLLRFKENSRSFWSDFEDGYFAERGGAAGEMKNPAGRTIYSNLTKESGVLGEVLSELKIDANLKMANLLLFKVDSLDPLEGRVPVDDLIDWAYGLDKDGNARLDMGDPLHSKPAVVSYGGTPENPDVTVFVTTNDGFLHAINGGLDGDGYIGGKELWSFIPRELLSRLEKLYLNEEVAEREYGLDSPIRTLRYDKNGDGKILKADGDRVILYFGMRRGGAHYFAVDVTDRTAPKLLWRIGAADDYLLAGSAKYLPGIGQTWSVPAIARVNVSDHPYPADNPLKWVLVFGGGYNTNHDRVGYLVDGSGQRIFDTTGNRIYMVDAISGTKIWRAGPAAGDAGAKLKLGAMNNAIPAEVRIVDMSGDGYADRMYAVDLGGQLWRFDIYNGKAAADLVAGGRIAALGNGDAASPVGNADSRRFFTAPDPSLITYQNESFVNIAIGSGHREKPVLDDETHNRAYGIRDYYPFVPLTQAQYDAREADDLVVRDTADDLSCDPANPPDPAKPLGVLMDVTTCNRAPIPAGSPGWKLDMTASGAWSGEKVLSESVTFQNIVYMPSYEPGPSADECAPAVGVNRLYEVSAATGATKLYWDNPARPDEGVREPPTELRQGGITSSVVFVFPEGEAGKRNPDPECLAGLAECGEGAKSRPVRTYWRQRGTQ